MPIIAAEISVIILNLILIPLAGDNGTWSLCLVYLGTQMIALLSIR